MMVCQRCHDPIASEAEARKHFAEKHADQLPSRLKPVEDLSVGLSGLTRGEAALVVLVVERMRAGGDGVERLRAKLKELLVDAYELDGDPGAARRVEATL